MTNVLKVAAAGLLAAMWSQGPAQSAELIVYTGMGAANGTYEVAEGFAKASGHKVTVSFEGGPSLTQKLQAKAPADLITGGVEGIEALIKDGHVIASTSTPFGMAGLGVSVEGRRATPKRQHARGLQGRDAGGEVDRLFARLAAGCMPPRSWISLGSPSSSSPRSSSRAAARLSNTWPRATSRSESSRPT